MTTVDESGAEDVAEALREIGATEITVTDTGDVTFKLLDTSAWAYYVTPTSFRLSFVLDFDADAGRAGAWVDEHDLLDAGFVRMVEGDDGATNLLYTVDLDRPATVLELVADTAIDLQTEWSGRDSAAIADTLADAGLLCPPIRVGKDERLRTYGPWWWGTRRVHPFKLYMFEVDEVVASLASDGPLFAMSHAGHGMNSYGLNLVTTGGPYAVFFQHGFGGVYTDPLRARLEINAAYTYLHVLLEADELEGHENPKWLLLYSQFRGTCGLVDLDEVRQGKHWEGVFREFEDFGSLIRGAVALAPDCEEFIVNGAGIDWGGDSDTTG